MPDINFNIKNKYDLYIEQHPECRLMSQDKVISIMLEKKCITAHEALIINPAYILDIKAAIENENKKIREINNIKFDTTPSPKQKNPLLNRQKYHKVFKDIIVTNTGQIDPGQFDIEYLKTTYPSYNYRFEVKKQSIIIYDKNTNQPVTNIEFSNNGKNRDIDYTVYTENEIRNYSIKNNIVESETIDDGKHLTYIDTYTSDNTIRTKVKLNKKTNQYETATYYYKNKEFSTINIKNGNNKNHVADNLYKSLHETNKLGRQIITDKFFKNIKDSRMDEHTVYKVLFDYKKKYKSDLLSDIENHPCIPADKKTNIMKHIKNLMIKSKYDLDRSAGKYLADTIANGFINNNAKIIEDNVMLINKDNMAITFDKFYETYRRLTDEMNRINKIPPYLSLSYMKSTKSKVYEPYRGLLTAIEQNSILTKTKKEKLIRHIKKCIEEGINTDIPDLYAEDIKADAIKHSNENIKLEVDIKRLGNRSPYPDNYYIKPNGKLDFEFKQNVTADCWLLTGIMSILEAKGGKELLESFLEYDEKTGNVTVNLKNYNRKYTITEEEIRNAKHLSQGDGDIRAIELAFDKYLKEYAYSNNSYKYDISNNYTGVLYRAFLEDSRYVDFKSVSNQDFNNKNYAYALAINDDYFKGEHFAYNTETGELVKLFSEHVYSIVKSDNYYLYIENPHTYTNFNNKSKGKRTILRIERKELLKLKSGIYRGKVSG